MPHLQQIAPAATISLVALAGQMVQSCQKTAHYASGVPRSPVSHDKFDTNILGISVPGVIQPASLSDNRWGWMVGTGVELAINNNWSAKVEYNYMDLGTKNYVFNVVPAVPAFNNWEITQRLHLIKFGLNYRFGWGPVVAAY
jgi:opacity protein-like surface antigen